MKRALLSLLLCACGNPLNTGNTVTPVDPPEKPHGGGTLTSPCERPLLGATTDEAFLLRADGPRVALARGGDQRWVAAPVARGGFIAVATTPLREIKYVPRLDLFGADGTLLASVDAGGTPV